MDQWATMSILDITKSMEDSTIKYIMVLHFIIVFQFITIFIQYITVFIVLIQFIIVLIKFITMSLLSRQPHKQSQSWLLATQTSPPCSLQSRLLILLKHYLARVLSQSLLQPILPLKKFHLMPPNWRQLEERRSPSPGTTTSTSPLVLALRMLSSLMLLPAMVLSTLLTLCSKY